ERQLDRYDGAQHVDRNGHRRARRGAEQRVGQHGHQVLADRTAPGRIFVPARFSTHHVSDRYASRCQYARCQRFESQPEISVPFKRLEAPATTFRQMIGMTTTFWMTRSFILMNSAARLTGSISL